jgi:hypothetical protein
MYHAYHLNVQAGDPVKNNVVRMHHDLALSGQALAVFVQVRMLGRLLQVVLDALQKMIRRAFVALGNELQYLEQVSAR